MPETKIPAYRVQLDLYEIAIRNQVQLLISSYGDGEWYSMLSKAGKNVNGDHFEMFCDRLKETLTDPRFTHFASNPMFWQKHFDADKHRDLASSIVGLLTLMRVPWVVDYAEWVYKETFADANLSGDLGGVLKLCRERFDTRVLVGGPHLMGLKAFGGLFTHRIETDSSDAYFDGSDRIHNGLMPLSRPTSLVMFCAGLSSNLYMHDLARCHFRGSMIDMGAVFDPYVERFSRKNYRRGEFKDAMKKNQHDYEQA